MNAVTVLGFKGNRPTGRYDDLVDRLADEEPRHGFTHADQLRPLTDAEVRLVYEARAVDLNDAFVKDFDMGDYIEDQPLILAAKFAFARERAARSVIYHDVAEECERRVQFSQWNEG